MRKAQAESTPKQLNAGEWHLPLIFDEDREAVKYRMVDPTETLCKISVGRCARVSYLTHRDVRDVDEDIRLHSDLMVNTPLHASPAEHVAMALETAEPSGNFYGWKQWRKLFPNENVPG